MTTVEIIHEPEHYNRNCGCMIPEAYTAFVMIDGEQLSKWPCGSTYQEAIDNVRRECPEAVILDDTLGGETMIMQEISSITSHLSVHTSPDGIRRWCVIYKNAGLCTETADLQCVLEVAHQIFGCVSLAVWDGDKGEFNTEPMEVINPNS